MSLIVDTTLRMSVIVLVALGATGFLRRRSAALRHWVLRTAIVFAAMLPLLQLALPSWRIGPSFSSAPRIEQLSGDVRTVISIPAAPTAVPRGADGTSPVTSAGNGRVRTALIWIWLAGALIGIAKLVAGLRRLARVRSGARLLDDRRLGAIARDAAAAVGLRRAATLLERRDWNEVITWGARRPAILLPAAARGWSDERVRVVLRHELAHVARGDWTAQILAETLRAVYWFNPLLWIASRRLRHEAERACDDVVLGGGVSSADYATHLLDLARKAAVRGTGPALAMARASSLEGRVSAMLNVNICRRPVTTAGRIATLVAFAALAVPVAVAQGRFWTFSGGVVDQTNRAVPDATLVLTNAEMRAKYEVRTDTTGRFEFVGLLPGEYQLAVQRPGFKTFKDAVTVGGQDQTRTIQLQIGSVHETIRVAAGPSEPPPSDPERQAKAEEARQRAEDLLRRASKECAGGPSPDAIGGQILPPLKLRDVRPDYPADLKAAGVGGDVTLNALIGTDGTVRDVTPLSSPHPALERAAADAVRGWQFSTTYLNCTPIEVPMQVTVSFVKP